MFQEPIQILLRDLRHETELRYIGSADLLSKPEQYCGVVHEALRVKLAQKRYAV